VCPFGESCQACLESDVCGFTEICADSFCIVDGAHQAKCRPLACSDPFKDQSLCGSDDAVCGECPVPDCEGRECGQAANSSASCGTCRVHRWCATDGKCQQRPEYQYCGGDLEAQPPEIPVVGQAEPAPEPQGGSISDGIYDLVAQRFNGSTAFLEKYLRGALAFSEGATRAEHIYDAEPGSQADDETPHRELSVSGDGTTLRFHIDCPGTVLFRDYERQFTAAGDELWLYQPGMVEIYQRRQ
jgi:hypothetical protein